MNKIYNTIIIGGGIAGLACANELTRKKKDFLLITENVGGRIITSNEGIINYGGYFIGPDCNNMLTCVKKGRQISPFKVSLHNKEKVYTMWRIFWHPFLLIKFLRIIAKFKKEYGLFKKRCYSISQKEAFEESPFLFNLYQQKAANFIKQQKLTKIINNLLGEGVYLCAFTCSEQLNAFDFLHILMHFNSPIYEFIFEKEKFIAPFKNKIKIDSVISIKKGKISEIKTKNKKYYARNIILATPIHVSKKLLKLKKIRGPINSYLFHIDGKLKKEWSHYLLHLFDNNSDIIFVATQVDKTHLIYSRTQNLNLNKYFETYKIIYKKHWKPAFNLKGHLILDAKPFPNLYMIGDYNVCGMEDSFITGVWAARQLP